MYAFTHDSAIVICAGMGCTEVQAFKSIYLFVRFDALLAWGKETTQCEIELGLEHDVCNRRLSGGGGFFPS